jgi:hypothetical protein
LVFNVEEGYGLKAFGEVFSKAVPYFNYFIIPVEQEALEKIKQKLHIALPDTLTAIIDIHYRKEIRSFLSECLRITPEPFPLSMFHYRARVKYPAYISRHAGLHLGLILLLLN